MRARLDIRGSEYAGVEVFERRHALTRGDQEWPRPAAWPALSHKGRCWIVAYGEMAHANIKALHQDGCWRDLPMPELVEDKW